MTGGLPLGGTTTLLRYVADALLRKGVSTEVFSFSWNHPMHAEFERDGIPVTRFDDRGMIYEDVVAAVYAKVREFRPSAVFAWLGPPAFEFLRHVPQGVLRVGTIHDHYQLVYDLLGTFSDAMDAVAAGSKITETQTRALLPHIPCEYLPYGIRFEASMPRRIPNGDRPLQLLFFGRFDEGQKQVSMFPKIVAELERREIPYCWTFHGQGPDEALLKEPLAPQVKAGKVRFSQPVDHGNLAALIAAHDVYMLASTHETGPLTLLEAMGCGLVPVCGKIPCLVDEVVKDGENGSLVPVDDQGAYVDAIARLHQDRQCLERLSAATAQIAASEYSSEAMARRYLDFVRKFAGTSTGTADWPRRIDVRSELLRGLKYHPILRPLRRFAKRFNVMAGGGG